MENNLKSFLEISYDRLEQLNLAAKEKRQKRVTEETLKEFYLDYLKSEKKLKAVTIGFSDIEGRFHLLDYDKKFFIKSYDNLTFDGSSIRGFSRQAESDLRLKIDWPAFWYLPADVFGAGKVLLFGRIIDQDGSAYQADTRGILQDLLANLYKTKKYTVYAANEIEGFLVKGIDAEQTYNEKIGFELTSTGGYYHTLPNDTLRIFIDRAAEAQRALGFQNEKDHPEVAPSQFELNYSYTDALIAADQIQIYKLICRQIARNMGLTATFLPKPMVGINGSGMHTNISVGQNGKNLFYDATGKGKLSAFAWQFIDRILGSANDICLLLNASVNAYRRLDPHFEAPNEIKVSETDRGSMIRIPLHNKESARIEVRSVGPDANPYLVLYSLIRTGFEGSLRERKTNTRERVRFLPGTIQTALAQFRQSSFIETILGTDLKEKYIELKSGTAKRCPEELGTKVKNNEVIYHHEVYNQYIWNDF